MATSFEDSKKNWSTFAWYGLVGYVFMADIALELSGNELMTDAWHRALRHPVARWGVIAAWTFTTKHLFFRNFLPKIDPFGAMLSGVRTVKKVGDKYDH